MNNLITKSGLVCALLITLLTCTACDSGGGGSDPAGTPGGTSQTVNIQGSTR